MPKYYNNVRPAPQMEDGVSRTIDLNKVSPEPEAPYPVADGAGDGASKGYKPTLSKTMGSTNVPQPDNKGPVKASGGDGKDGMAG